jgi:hypothetical protein
MKKITLLLFIISSINTSAYGQITVKLALPNNCYFDINTHLSVDNDSELSNLKVIPNPNTGSFTLDFSQQGVLGKLFVVIFDTRGKIVYQETIFSDSNSIVKKISLNDLLPGIYLLEVKNNHQASITKLVINKAL